jgi:NADPH:quinone reductase-like Zn-dependent oxidoreductase
MQAVIWTGYGPPEVLRVQEIERPNPKANEILVNIHAATVSAGDCEMRALAFAPWLKVAMRSYAGLRRPTRITILGQELAGEVTAVGGDVSRFRVGDRVFGTPGFAMGAYAEYIALPATGGGVLATIPAGVSDEQAATLPVGGLTSLHFLRQAQLRPGQTVLINGAGGSIGTIAIQLAKRYGAEVTAVDSAAKLAMLREIGADHVIDYAQEDFTRNGKKYDVIMDVVGKSAFAASVASLNDRGVYLLVNPSLSHTLRARLGGTAGKRVIAGSPAERPEDLTYLAELVAAGELRPVIDRRYSLAEVPEAHRYVESGAKVGNVVVAI